MMNNLHTKIHFILFVLIVSIASIAASPNQRKHHIIKQYTTSDGLAINGVNALCRDRKGYLWVATYDGLNRYNGYTFTTYNMQNTANAFRSNRMRTIAEMVNGDILIGSDNGVSVYSYYTNSFSALSLDGVELREVNCIVKNIFTHRVNGEIYCITEADGIIVYDSHYNFVRVVKYQDNATCNDAILLDDSHILLSTSKGLELYDMHYNVSQSVLAGSVKLANSALKISSASIVVALQKGVQMVDVVKWGDKYNFEISSPIYYPHDMIKSIALDESSNLWLGTKIDGLRIVDINDLGDQSATVSLLPKERISTMLFEDDAHKWVATYDSGLYQFDDAEPMFKGLSSDYLDRLQKIIQVVPYANNKLLIRSVSNQLSIYDIKRNTLSATTLSLTPKEFNNIHRITYDKRGLIWLLYNTNDESYLIAVDPKSGEVKRIKHEGLANFRDFNGYVLSSENSGDLWIATPNDIHRVTFDDDLQVVSVESLSDSPFFEGRKIHATRIIYPDRYRDQVWIGSINDGLYRLWLDGDKRLSEIKISHYSHDVANDMSLSNNSISAIHRTTDGTLYVGSEHGGLCRVVESGDDLHFKSYTHSDGLSNNAVKGILTDQNNELWISTSIGLNHFDPDSELFTIYRKSDGVPFENFNYAHIQLPNGRMAFVGGNNFIQFNPIDIPNREELPNLWFSSLTINGNSIASGEEIDGRAILDKSLSDKDEIELKYNENSIAIGVDVLSGANSNNYKIQYKLEPHSQSWNTILASDNTILFDGLQPDTYKLSVRCCNFYGVWSQPKELTIKISPPIWQTTAAYIIYVLLLLAVVCIVLYSILHVVKLRHQLQIELISKHNLENLNREKQRYFSNISHELKTPLTLILAPIAVLSEKFKLDVNVTRSLQVINRQSKKMLQLVDLAHNVQLESDNLLTLRPSVFDFAKFVDEITTDFKYYADSDNKRLKIDQSSGDIIVSADKSLIEKILNNLLSNAFKHTRHEDSINLSYSTDGEILIITVEDSGYGIDEADLPRIFERFYQAKRRGAANIGGTGIGLTFSQTIARLHGGEIDVESKFGVGTKFTVKLPIIVDTSLYEAATESEKITSEELESALILGDMNIESIEVREDLRGSMVYLVEDNPDMREFLEGIIKQFYNVQSYSNGVECLEAMKSSWPDIVLTDVMMPQMDGYELCSAIKNNPLTSHIPVIMLTACSTIDEKIKGLSHGADSYIPKPFYPRHTITRIDALLYNRKKLRERFLVDEKIMKGPTAGNKDNEFMNNLYKLFSENLSNDEIDIDSIASAMCVSRTLFFQKIKAITNDSPYELLKNYRLKRAAEYLAIGDTQVNEVSFLVGFKSRTHFSKLFKEKYGYTPGKYAKMAKNGEL